MQLHHACKLKFHICSGDGDGNHDGDGFHAPAVAFALIFGFQQLEAKPVQVAKLSESKIKAMFDTLDQDRDGLLSLNELLEAVKEGRMGLIHSESACRAFFSAVDMDEGHQFLDFDHFYVYIRQRELMLTKLFQRMDLNGDGKVSCDVSRLLVDRVLPDYHVLFEHFDGQ